MQQKISVVEMEKMKELLQRSEAEKGELFRRVEAFETKQKQDLMYHNQLIKRDSNLKTTIGKLELAIKNLEQEHKEVMELSKSANVATEAIENYRLLLENYKRIDQEKNNFEAMYIKVNAQYETLEKLLNSRDYMQESNLLGKLIVDQWESSRQHYEEHLEENEEIIKNLIEGYNNEKSVNSKLIEKNSALKEENASLRAKLELINKELESLKQKYSELETKTPDCSIVIKDELIEID
ncbi:unnamed protein product [Phyllotreta striolata]|uniref:Uncharacterized protein n=1 Tax=Phyllotreta striolata TaxID=444603 RepID=A0A9N9TVX5_PHYSR|nr:unnamed protein product [Phyllotreta striolata]